MMEERFMTSKEVAAFLRVSVRTLYNRASRHEIYRPSQPGIWDVKHVEILACVWSGAITEDAGLALWKYELLKMRRILAPLKKSKDSNATVEREEDQARAMV